MGKIKIMIGFFFFTVLASEHSRLPEKHSQKRLSYPAGIWRNSIEMIRQLPQIQRGSSVSDHYVQSYDQSKVYQGMLSPLIYGSSLQQEEIRQGMVEMSQCIRPFAGSERFIGDQLGHSGYSHVQGSAQMVAGVADYSAGQADAQLSSDVAQKESDDFSWVLQMPLPPLQFELDDFLPSDSFLPSGVLAKDVGLATQNIQEAPNYIGHQEHSHPLQPITTRASTSIVSDPEKSLANQTVVAPLPSELSMTHRKSVSHIYKLKPCVIAAIREIVQEEMRRFQDEKVSPYKVQTQTKEEPVLLETVTDNLESEKPFKRKYIKQKPERATFVGTDEEFQAAFTKWQEQRASNAKAVKKSRLKPIWP